MVSNRETGEMGVLWFRLVIEQKDIVRCEVLDLLQKQVLTSH